MLRASMSTSRKPPELGLTLLLLVGAAGLAIPSWVIACDRTGAVDRGDTTRSVVLIASAGGRVDGPLGASIVVPPGALTADTRVGIALSDDTAHAALPDAAVPRGAVFAFTPHGLPFAVPATLTVPSTATGADNAVVLRAADEGSPWALGPTATVDDAGAHVFSSSRLSLFTVVGTGDAGPAGLFPPGQGDGCSPELKSSRWATMLGAALTLPGRAAGIDLRGAASQGISRPEIEGVLCAGAAKGNTFGADTETFSWGGAGEVSVVFDVASGKARFAVLTGAYTGAIDLKAADGGTSYRIGLGAPLQKAGAPVVIPWADATALAALMDDIDRALRTTFLPGTPLPSTACTTTAPATCERGALGSAGYLYFRTLGLAIWVGDTTAADRASTPSRLDVYAVTAAP
jgi:hypothetical protein